MEEQVVAVVRVAQVEWVASLVVAANEAVG